MLRWIAVLCVLFKTATATSIMNEEVEEDVLVRFHWSESNKMRNNTKYGVDVRRRAAALDGQLATIMKPPFGPFWSKNPRRIVIQSLDDPDLILAVKQRNLQLVEPIKIHLFHAKNDISTSDEYLEKEKRVLSSNNYTAALLSVHPDRNNGSGTLGCCLEKHSFLDELRWYSLPILTQEDLAPQERERTVNRLKVSIKSVISRLLHVLYGIGGSSIVDILNNIEGYDERFKNTLLIQSRMIVRDNGTYQGMEWLRNNLIDINWMAQGMYFIYDHLDERMQMVSEEMLSPMTESASTILSVIHPLIMRSIQEIANQTHARNGVHLSRSQTAAELILSMSGGHSATPMPTMAPNIQRAVMLLGIREVLTPLAQHVNDIQEMAMIRNIGTSMAAVHRFVSQEVLEGSSIAIVIPGDLLLNLDRLQHLLYRIIKKLGWKYQCKLEVFEL